MQLHKTSYRAAYDYMVREVRNALPIDAKILTHRKLGLIAWRGDNGDGARFYFYFGSYNEITYRLVIRYRVSDDELPKHFWMVKIGWPHPRTKEARPAGPRYGSELSFHKSEVSSIKGSDLVRFVCDCFRCTQREDIYRWPLFFAHQRPIPWWSVHGRTDDVDEDPWRSDYAWTVRGKIEQTKRELQRHAQQCAGCPLCQVET